MPSLILPLTGNSTSKRSYAVSIGSASPGGVQTKWPLRCSTTECPSPIPVPETSDVGDREQKRKEEKRRVGEGREGKGRGAWTARMALN